MMSVAKIFGGEGGSVQGCSAVKIYFRRGKTLARAVRGEGEKVRKKSVNMKIRKEGGGEDFPGAGAAFTLHFVEETPVEQVFPQSLWRGPWQGLNPTLEQGYPAGLQLVGTDRGKVGGGRSDRGEISQTNQSSPFSIPSVLFGTDAEDLATKVGF